MKSTIDLLVTHVENTDEEHKLAHDVINNWNSGLHRTHHEVLDYSILAMVGETMFLRLICNSASLLNESGTRKASPSDIDARVTSHWLHDIHPFARVTALKGNDLDKASPRKTAPRVLFLALNDKRYESKS